MCSIYEFEMTVRSIGCKCQNLTRCHSGIIDTYSCYTSGYLGIYNTGVLQIIKAAQALCLQVYQHLAANYLTSGLSQPKKLANQH